MQLLSVIQHLLILSHMIDVLIGGEYRLNRHRSQLMNGLNSFVEFGCTLFSTGMSVKAAVSAVDWSFTDQPMVFASETATVYVWIRHEAHFNGINLMVNESDCCVNLHESGA